MLYLTLHRILKLNHAMRNHISSASVATKSQGRKSLMGILDFKMSSLRERFVTLVTLIWFLPSVRSHMDFQIITSRKYFVTLTTLHLKSNMPIKLFLPWDFVATEAELIWFLMA